MKVLVVGGAHQGKTAYAERVFGSITKNALHLWVRELLAENRDPLVEIPAMLGEDWVVLCDEVGCGVVPVDAADRRWREVVGRLCCLLAERADVLERVTCGVPLRLKGM